MPGAFAHITAVNFATENKSLSQLAIPKKAKFILSQNQKYLELGCVSPDYPYLVMGLDKKRQNKWADLMHYERTGEVIKAAIAYCKTLEGNTQEKSFAWLCGYMAHVAADITIHPVVELKVGPYEQNQKAHRVCEMNQDAFIWQRLNLGEIGYADRVELNIGSCTNANNELDDDIKQIWRFCLEQTHPEYTKNVAPDFDAWHSGFQFVVNNAEESYRLFPWARHVGVGHGLTYPMLEEVDLDYIAQLDTPRGEMHYNDVFDLAIENIKYYITIIANSIFSDTPCDVICNWNLDTGKDETNKLTAWEH